MGLWNKGLQRSQTDELPLVIEDGVLIRCKIKEGIVTIPDQVEKVSVNAFDGCENVTIDISTSELAGLISLTLKSLEREFKVHPRVVEFGDPNPLLKIWNMPTDSVESAIKAAVAKREEQNPDIKWNITTIDADKIADICREIEMTGRDNLVRIEGDKVSTLRDIPFLMASQVRQLGAYSDYVNDLTDKEGYGILYIKNLNSENVRTFPRNFIYNLINSHIFSHVHLSSKWEVILECGEGVKLDGSEDIGYVFNGNYYRNIPMEKYMEDMKRYGKVIEPEIKDPETTVNSEEKESEQHGTTDNSLTIQKEKEVAWEERHFRICLALISREDIYNSRSNKPVPVKIIKAADEMVEALKKHYQEQKQK